MSMRSKSLGGAAALALVSSVGTLGIIGTMSAQAATPQCGNSCIQVFSPRFGTPAHTNFIESVRHGLARVGQPTILGAASSTDPAGDFVPLRPAIGGLVSDFFAAGMIPGAAWPPPRPAG